MTNEQLVAKLCEDASTFLTSPKDYSFFGDDDTDYIPAAIAILGLAFEALASERGGDTGACDDFVARIQNLDPESPSEDDHFFYADLINCDFSSPLLEAPYFTH